MEERLKVGDTVRVTGDTAKMLHGYDDGTIGTLVEYEDGDWRVSTGSRRLWVSEKDLEILRPPQFAQSQPALVETLDERDDAHLRPAMWPNASSLPSEPAQRKAVPVTTGVLDYFPAAIAEVARVSKAGNEQHHPGQPLHWERGKSTDHADTITRHLMDRGTLDTDGQRHSAKVAWRALALLQEELEAEGAPKARGSR